MAATGDVDTEIESMRDTIKLFGAYKIKAMQTMLASRIIGKFYETYAAYITDHPGDTDGALNSAKGYLDGLDNPNTTKDESWDFTQFVDEANAFLNSIGPERNQGIDTFDELQANIVADVGDDGLVNNSTGNNIMLMEVDGLSNVKFITRKLWAQTIMYDNFIDSKTTEIEDLARNRSYYEGEEEG